MKRHDAVVTYVEKSLERRGIPAQVEYFETAVGLRKPDLIIEMKDSTLMIDTQLVSKQRNKRSQQVENIQLSHG